MAGIHWRGCKAFASPRFATRQALRKRPRDSMAQSQALAKQTKLVQRLEFATA